MKSIQKSRLTVIRSKLKDNRISCRENTDDADTLIVTIAIEKPSFSDRVPIVGEDVDLLVLFIALIPLERDFSPLNLIVKKLKEIYFPHNS